MNRLSGSIGLRSLPAWQQEGNPQCQGWGPEFYQTRSFVAFLTAKKKHLLRATLIDTGSYRGQYQDQKSLIAAVVLVRLARLAQEAFLDDAQPAAPISFHAVIQDYFRILPTLLLFSTLPQIIRQRQLEVLGEEVLVCIVLEIHFRVRSRRCLANRLQTCLIRTLGIYAIRWDQSLVTLQVHSSPNQGQ